MSTDEMQEAVRIDGPAYPMLEPSSVEGMYGLQFRGLTKRELFAAMAMQGLMAGKHFEQYDYVVAAKVSVRAADALLAALEALHDG